MPLVEWPSEARAGSTGSSQCSNVRNVSGKTVHNFGTPIQPASALPAASTISGTVIVRGDSWACASERDWP